MSIWSAFLRHSFFVSARKSAPNDGTGLGEVQGAPNAHSRSKQNSDAVGMLYQWGRKDPFTYVTSSLSNGSSNGKYPVKIYSHKSELIYQEDIGKDNLGMTPVGGVIYQNLASSMMETIKKPNLFYYGGSLISQDGHSKDMWNYHWTSHSRGTDGKAYERFTQSKWHNTYLDGYIALRSKSIYDPCPYGYRTPTNGTYNDFSSNQGWTFYSYTGGTIWNNTWLTALGVRNGERYTYSGHYEFRRYSTIGNKASTPAFGFYPDKSFYLFYLLSQANGYSVRCIEDATVMATDIFRAARS